MSSKKINNITSLQDKIEDALSNKSFSKDELSSFSEERLVEELYIYQTELLAQNNELQNTNYELAKTLEENDYLFEEAPVAYIITNQGTKVEKLNRLARLTFGLDGTNIKYMMLQNILSVNETSKLLRWINEHESISNPYELEIETNKGLRWFSVTGSVIEDGNYLFAFFDIHIKKEQEGVLKSQKDELEAIFNNSKDGIALLDMQSNFIRVNKAYIDMSGYEEYELLKKSCIEMSIPEDVSRTKEAIADIVKIGSIENFEKRCISRNGKIISVNISATLMPNKKAILLSVKDITELKLQEVILIRQERLAKMGEMISMIAHQWRQPLSVISMGMNNMLLDIELETFDVDKAKNYAKDVINQNEHLSKTIDDFRNFFKADKQAEICTINKPINQAISIIKVSLESSGIELEINYLDEEREINIYRGEIIQVILNILKNSQDSFQSNKIQNKRIIITSKYSSDAEKVLLHICDNAGGIDNSIIDQIFDPYFSTKNEKNGMGIGLYMSKTIIENHHNGKLECSNTDDGVCFHIEIYSV